MQITQRKRALSQVLNAKFLLVDFVNLVIALKFERVLSALLFLKRSLSKIVSVGSEMKDK